jgi:prepilin signal peptidase PulO-like enzyme (type II secretory pathway)
MRYIFAFILGWITGIIINYCADVLPERRRFSSPFCRFCGVRQSWINYLLWPKKCRFCQQYRSPRSWIVEIFYSIFSELLVLYSPARLGYFISLVTLAYLGVVFIIDLEHHLILHPVSLAGILLFCSIGIKLHGILDTLWGGVAGLVIMLVLYGFGLIFIKALWRLRNQTSGEKEGLGFGDVIFCGVTGLILGWPGIISGIILTIILAGFVSLGFLLVKLILRKYSYNLALPFGPFLVLSVVILIFLNKQLISLF